MKIKQSLLDMIGNTPLLKTNNFMNTLQLNAEILAKLEGMNPAGSAKDRVAKSMILDAEERGDLSPGAVIIEPTSGNTGIGLAAVAAMRGYRLILTMPDTMSIERRNLLTAYGAEVVLTEGALGMQGAIEKAVSLSKSIPNSFIPGQFDNPSNVDAHYRTTGPEIWRDTDGLVDIFVAGVGTGGTLSGTGIYLKEKNPNTQVIAVEPYDSPVLSGGKAGKHALQGIGAGFIPKILDLKVIDRVMKIQSEEAYRYARTFVKTEGILIGISGGAALCAAVKLAMEKENYGKRIVVVLPDTGERYLSTPIFSTN